MTATNRGRDHPATDDRPTIAARQLATDSTWVQLTEDSDRPGCWIAADTETLPEVADR